MSLPSHDPQISALPPPPSSQGPRVTAPSFPPPPFPPPAPEGLQFLPDGLQTVSISSVRAALEKLEINIPVDDVLTAIRDVEAKRIADRQANLSELAQIITPTERRRRIARIAKEGFPHGVPDPFVST